MRATAIRSASSRLSGHGAQHQLSVLAQMGERHAARLLVQHGARLARPRGRRQRRAQARRARGRRLGARKLPTRKAPVMFVPEIARGLIGHFLGAIRGGASTGARRSCSMPPASRCSRSGCRSSERPHCARHWRAPVRSRRRRDARSRADRDGVLQGYMLGSYSARKLGLQATGNAGGRTT